MRPAATVSATAIRWNIFELLDSAGHPDPAARPARAWFASGRVPPRLTGAPSVQTRAQRHVEPNSAKRVRPFLSGSGLAQVRAPTPPGQPRPQAPGQPSGGSDARDLGPREMKGRSPRAARLESKDEAAGQRILRPENQPARERGNPVDPALHVDQRLASGPGATVPHAPVDLGR